MKNIKILSVEECLDKDYGKSIVQYQIGEHFVSFAFTRCNVFDLNGHMKEIKSELNNQSLVLWSDLSEELRTVIMENPFDMNFIEFDSPGWSKEFADMLWEEATAKGLGDVVTRDEDDCYLTIYAGAINDINWFEHPEYGIPCLLHNHIMNFSLDNSIQMALNQRYSDSGKIPEKENEMINNVLKTVQDRYERD